MSARPFGLTEWPENECPPVGGATEGRGIALEANAGAPYPAPAHTGKSAVDTRQIGVKTQESLSGTQGLKIAFRASTGRIWAFRGKRGRVLEMLATMLQGVTQWDCYPWHTRLAASIEAMRKAGLSIDMEREGDCRHGRYFLRTPGCLIIQAENSVEPVKKHRVTP